MSFIHSFIPSNNPRYIEGLPRESQRFIEGAKISHLLPSHFLLTTPSGPLAGHSAARDTSWPLQSQRLQNQFFYTSLPAKPSLLLGFLSSKKMVPLPTSPLALAKTFLVGGILDVSLISKLIQPSTW